MTKPSIFLFSYFVGQGEDGLHLAVSYDGLLWTPLENGRSFLRPRVGSGVMRDPSISLGPDRLFRLVWTTGWFDRGIGLACSTDLVHWTEQQFVPVMAHEPGALNCWAPEVFFDDATTRSLILWSTTIPGRFPETDDSGDLHGGHRLNHRIYFCSTVDFESFSEARVLYDGGFNVIDATIVRTPTEYVMMMKDETSFPEVRKHLRLATSQRADGPYGPASAPLSTAWVEGPSVLQVEGHWLAYFDEYTRYRYGAIRSRDLRTWETISDRLVMPPHARHGSAIAVPAGRVMVLAHGAAQV